MRVAVTRYHSDLPYPDNVCPHLDLSTTSHMVTTPKSKTWSPHRKLQEGPLPRSLVSPVT